MSAPDQTLRFFPLGGEVHAITLTHVRRCVVKNVGISIGSWGEVNDYELQPVDELMEPKNPETPLKSFFGRVQAHSVFATHEEAETGRQALLATFLESSRGGETQ